MAPPRPDPEGKQASVKHAAWLVHGMDDSDAYSGKSQAFDTGHWPSTAFYVDLHKVDACR